MLTNGQVRPDFNAHIALTSVPCADFGELKSKTNLSCLVSDSSSRGPLADNISAWASLDPPSYVKQAISGHCLSLNSKPPLVLPLPSMETVTTKKQSLPIQKAVNDLLRKHAIEPAPVNRGFYSRLFTVPKKDGTRRPVINLKPLNRFITTPKFHMASIPTVAKVLQPLDWSTSIDLKDAFFHIPIHNRFRRFLRFLWKGRAYQFRLTPFGLSTAPYTFTRITRPVMKWCRARGMRVIFYLDDILILAKSPRLASYHTQLLLEKLTKLGFKIKKEVHLHDNSLTSALHGTQVP